MSTGISNDESQTPKSIALQQAAVRQRSYDQYMAGVSEVLGSHEPEHKAIVAKANKNFARIKLLGPSAVHVDATLSNISVQYKNGEYIGELLMPPVPVPKLSDKYFMYDKRNRLAYPDDNIGARGDANEVNETRSILNYSCQPYGYKNFVDALTLANEDAPLNEMVDLVEAIAEGIAFRRELRIALKLTTAANYPTANKQTNTGSGQWDSAAGGDPVADLQAARAALWTGRGPGKICAWSSLEVYNVLARHPKVLDLFKYGGTAPGLATPTMIAQFFGFDDYFIGEARQDTANDGQAAGVYARIWGKFFGVARVATRPSLRNAAFGYTMRFGDVRTDQWFDLAKGQQGAYYARVSVNEDHNVVAADTAYLITSPIS